MVARITPGYSIRRAFHYNENKLKVLIPVPGQVILPGKKVEMMPAACLLHAVNYPMDLSAMKEGHRINMLLKLAERNTGVTNNSIHISLNFSNKDSLTDQQMSVIAEEYMDGMGYGNQPYLVYRHFDAGHPHLHIVTVKVDHNGDRIETQGNFYRSEVIRKEIENRHGLTPAEQHKSSLKEHFLPKPQSFQKGVYGKSETYRTIANTLEHVILKYKYASIGELNAVLSLGGVCAETGAEGSRLKRYKGLQYRLLDREGKPAGIPIKASIFHSKPTLKFLEKRFLINATARNTHKTRLRSIIDFALKSKSVKTLDDLQSALKRDAVQLIPRINENGFVYGITFIDHEKKCVFNGRKLGPDYSAKAISERLNTGNISREKLTIKDPNPRIIFPFPQKENPDSHNHLPSFPSTSTHTEGIVDILFRSENADEPIPYPLRAKKKKMKKKQNE
ncbi:relaxase/mobilization nuclease domain-containing protein [Chitinophaga niabensis]|uniref:Relaxase/Mobilisation nuclease domain-containing protein n=1 Tax=Chitinophaga niabensis TaxID=536979 RepID=A0A1N6E2I8_9BACT|nr:relaxase/mobilization nuclease domain-containing protein [Chitinophaga niabensis]SIN77193.1 Relaxase/Mobilisation nuclease domain-containing protein [Chitinophaga niabensis]